MNNGKSKPVEQIKTTAPQKEPNERSGVYISTHFKIFDPNTNEVLLQQRGD